MSGKGTLYFFTGLAGAGKTTIGGLFYERLKARKPDAVLLDGHQAREKLAAEGVPGQVDPNLPGKGQAAFTYEFRLAMAHRMFEQCKALTDQGRDVVYCSISLFHEIREWNRNNFENYREIYLKVDMDTLRKRRAYLYSGEEKLVVGLDVPWDEPGQSNVVIDNSGTQTPEAIVDRLEAELLGSAS